MDSGIVFLLLCGLVLVGIIAYKISERKGAEERRRERQKEREERQRVEDCGEVVLFFANTLGYIARECISREELEELIDSGIDPDSLAGEIASRIELMPGLVLGYHAIGQAQIPVKLTKKFRDRHIYIIGKSGSGKTNLIRNLVMQDLVDGYGLGVIAPEQEMLTEEILPFIPEDRLDDVIYFNPADVENPVCFNPLHLDQGEDIDLKADETLTIFKRVLAETTGPRMEQILRQALYALMEIPGTTLLDMERLLDRHNPGFREEVANQLKDESTRHFWQEVYPSYPKDAHLPITTRLGRFIKPKVVRNCLCSPGRSLNFRNAMDKGKILLFNLSDGILGESSSQILGQLIVSKLQLAAMGRADIPKERRRPFYLYIDEFQTFTSLASASYDKMLSRARKYQLGLILAHQQTGQIPGHLLKEIFGNVSTMISFNISAEDVNKISREFVTEYDGQIEKIEPEEFLSLRIGQAYCKIGRNAFFMHVPLAPDKGSQRALDEVIRRSRENYGSKSGVEETKTISAVYKKKIEEKKKLKESIEEIEPGDVF